MIVTRSQEHRVNLGPYGEHVTMGVTVQVDTDELEAGRDPFEVLQQIVDDALRNDLEKAEAGYDRDMEFTPHAANWLENTEYTK